MTPRTQAWRDAGRFVEVAGRRIFVSEREGDGPPLLFLHGYPSSSYDWSRALELLPDRRALLFDFLGFGLSDKPRDHVYSLLGQADLAIEMARRFDRVVLVAHDMGTSVANELMARDLEGKLPFELAQVLLMNGSMILEKASLTLSQRVLRSRFGPLLARVSNRALFRAQFARVFSKAHPLTREEADDQWALLALNDGHRIIDKLTYYLHERMRYAARWHGAIRDWKGDLRILWAMQDPVCVEAVLDTIVALRPHAPVERIALGHYPQVEDPGSVAAWITSGTRAKRSSS